MIPYDCVDIGYIKRGSWVGGVGCFFRDDNHPFLLLKETKGFR